jgi:hypothetical protein
LVIALAIAWFTEADVTATAKVVGDTVQFDCRANWKVNSIYSISVWRRDVDEQLWWVYLPRDRKECKVIYGELQEEMQQKIPEDGSPPPPIPVGVPVDVGINFQFDTAIPPAPCTSSKRYRLELTQDGELSWGSVAR